MIKQPTSFHTYSILFLILNWFYFCKLITRNFGRWNMPESNIFFTTNKKYCSVSFTFALCQLCKIYLLYVFLSQNFLRLYFIHGGIVYFQCFGYLPFCILRSYLYCPLSKLYIFGLMNGWAKHKESVFRFLVKSAPLTYTTFAISQS